ncbi:exodeoxyribonuclease isoform X2 [Leptopilina boulardi]|uniref:exodeoxyribonuclease isoform X2 n=1 Tax=Leptopilina boulardi TaxID=63433 RepID=UPI0021F5BBFC|nr:exodeoxyribonuclease isoform X2 [Leptopilina boulardi]
MPAKRGRAKKQAVEEEGKNEVTKEISNKKKIKRDSDEEEVKEEPVAKKAKVDTKDTKPMINKVDSDLSKIDFTCKKLNADKEAYNIKICSWNVSGIRAVIKKNGFQYIKEEDADIVLLQEVKCNNASLPNEVKLPGYERYFLESKKPGYCGMAFFSKIKPIKILYGLQNSTFDIEGRIITAEFDNFYVINVYVPNSGTKLMNLQKRLDWNKAFNEHVIKLDNKKPVIICGDMNVAHQEIDLTNPKTNTKNAGFSPEEREGMTELLKLGFVDTFRAMYPEKTGAYSFWSYFRNARDKNIGWRLDYFIVSERIKNKICDNVMRDKVYGSDHCPIVLYAHL